MTDEQQNNLEFNIDRSNLYREESFSDLKTGVIKRLTPVKADGSADKSRKTRIRFRQRNYRRRLKNFPRLCSRP